MTPAEQEQMYIFGANCSINVMSLLVSTLTSAIAALGILIAMHLLPGIESWREPKAIQLLCCLSISLSWIVQSILGYTLVFDQIRAGTMMEFSTPPLIFDIINNIQTSVSQLMVMVGDLVICWRAWVLVPHDKVWRFGLAIIVICNVGFNIADIILVVLGGNGSVINNNNLLQNLGWASIAFSWLTNMAVTSLIGWKAWAHYRTIREVFYFFFVESGAMFLVIQSFALIGAILSTAMESVDTINWVVDVSQEVWQASAEGTLSACHNCHNLLGQLSHCRNTLSNSSTPDQCLIR
ncbi:hypothetical protein BDP27DRAFT_1321195 [Rhodocollybia butyracea]|uniref:Uncharacterized protein n=1 Tax=Rhodocollybia butyracea TaxID=206335 RepID=A0A9P5PZA5_9AGAR|nr:hypothetical protein BDP27DRAFT_1321195 [Rhodocollybia butyracea]